MPKGKIMGENKAVNWKGDDLKGTWEFTRKIDGARMLRDSEGNPVSRSGKPLYNLQDVPKEIVDAEIFDTDWETSMGLVRSSVNGSRVPLDKVYSLVPLDSRLYLHTIDNPTADYIDDQLQLAIARKDEGLMLRQGLKWLRVKPKETADVFVTGFQKGTGKHEGRMGALLTNYGKVGTGFTDHDREWWQSMFDNGGNQWLTKQLIEVEFMEWTSGKKFRHPRFLRIRDDKTEESV